MLFRINRECLSNRVVISTEVEKSLRKVSFKDFSAPLGMTIVGFFRKNVNEARSTLAYSTALAQSISFYAAVG